MREARLQPCDADCPVRRSMDILDGKWMMLIIRELLKGRRRFGEMLGAIGGISPKVLAQRLRLLEAERIITRTIYSEVPPRVEYELTERGHGLRAVVEALAGWGASL